MIKIYGCSDDLIEIEGDIEDELNPPSSVEDEGAFLAFSDGTVLRVKYDGVWRITPVFVNTNYSKVEAPEDDDSNYSDVVTLTGNITWVVMSERLIK